MPEPIILVRELVIWVATESYPIELASFGVVNKKEKGMTYELKKRASLTRMDAVQAKAVGVHSTELSWVIRSQFYMCHRASAVSLTIPHTLRIQEESA